MDVDRSYELLYAHIDTFSNATTLLSASDIAAGTVGAFGAGVLLLLWLIPLPLITQLKYVRKRTLWEFENVWLPLSTVAFFICPVVLFFAVVPISNLREYTNSGLFKVEQWVPGILIICLWCTAGLTCYTLAIDYIGIVATNCIVLPVCTAVSMLIKMLRFYPVTDLKEAVFVSGQSIALWIVFGLSLTSFILSVIGSVFKEKSTREQRKELAQNVERDIAAMNSGKAAKEKKNKEVSTLRIVIKFYIGLTCSVIAACSFYLIPLAFSLSSQLFYNMLEGGQLSMFQSHTALLTLGLIAGYVPSFLIAFGLLIVNGTIKKYAVCSGGAVALTGVNFKFWRLICLIITVIMGVCLTASLFLQWSVSDAYMGGFAGSFEFNYGVWNISVAYIVYLLVSALFAVFPLFEFKKTKWPERILFGTATVISLIALSVSMYFAYPTKWHVL